MTELSTAEKGYLDMICKHCLVALMYDHPENELYNKCELCGFCEKKIIKQGIAFRVPASQVPTQ